jgi:hypothetical protein
LLANYSKEGKLYAAYIDNNGNAGILKGSLSGTNYYDIDMFDASGTINRVQFGSSGWSSTDLATGDVNFYNSLYTELSYANEIYWQTNSMNDAWGVFTKSTDNLVTSVNVQEVWSGQNNRVDWDLKISALGNSSNNALDWGTFSFLSKALYTPTLANKNWLMGTDVYWEESGSLINIITYTTWGDTWANGKLTGRGNGAWAAWNDGTEPFTAVLHGDTLGAYNDSLAAFGASTAGAWVKTDVFRQMVDDALTGGGRTKLSSLGFPTVEVGTSQVLTGQWAFGSSSLNVTVGDNTQGNQDKVRFFAYNSGEFPKIWIANSVTGSYSGTIDTSVKAYLQNDTLANATLFGDFSIKRWESNSWLADIEFMGGLGSNTQGWFFGIAAGTYDTSSFAGTAAGISEPATALSKLGTIDVYKWDGTYKTSDGNLYGVMANNSIWNLPVNPSDPFEFEFVGVHDIASNNTNPHTWHQTIEPYNYLSSDAKTTTDGGSYYGWVGGYQLPIDGTTGNGRIDAAFYALYVDPDKNIGILRGVNPDTSTRFIYSGGYWSMGLDGFTAKMGSDTNIVAANFGTNYVTVTDTGEGVSKLNGSDKFYNDSLYSSLKGAAGITLSNTRWRDANITGQNWGIWQMYLAGGFDTAYTSNYWTLELLPQTSEVSAGTAIMNIETWGTKWGPSDTNEMLAKHRGYFADISGTPKTGIYVGELKGTFNAATWQAVSTGAWISTDKLLSMACPNGTCNTSGTDLTPAQQALRNLNIPVVEVGRANFSLSDNTNNPNITSLSMSNVIFLANQSGQKATMWATGNVSGNYSANPTLNQAVTLSGSAGSVDFTPKAWSDNKWMATINGTGINLGSAPNNNLTVNGAGAGTYSGGNFSGTAAGTAK